MEITTYLSIITLNENDINVPIIRHGVLEWIKKKKAHLPIRFALTPGRTPLCANSSPVFENLWETN